MEYCNECTNANTCNSCSNNKYISSTLNKCVDNC